MRLVDRSTYPTALTDEGRAFRETAQEVLRLLENARADIHALRRPSRQTASFAALHTLALSFFPYWLKDIETALGSLRTEVLADNAHNCIQAFVEGDSDFLLTFHHDAAPMMIDEDRFPHVVLGHDRLTLVTRTDEGRHDFTLGNDAAYLAYGRDSFLGRLSEHAARLARLNLTPIHVNDAAMAEALKAMVLAGHGIAWLPESLIRRELASGLLAPLGESLSMEVRLFRSAGRKRPVAERIWEVARQQAG